MSKNEEQQIDVAVKQEDIDKRLKASEQKLKELQLEQNERAIKELERQAELAKKIADNINSSDTQLKTPTKPVIKDPGVALDEFFENRNNFELTYGHGEKYNREDPRGLLKIKLVLDKKQMEENEPELTQDEIKQRLIEKYKDELVML